ncbi:MAG: hypothetical protein V4611_00970 [Patescibacteria group bacterium]
MNPSLLAIRAIATELSYRIYQPIVIGVSILTVVLIGLMIWLITLSTWWILLAVPVFLAIIVVAILLVLAGLAIRVVSPRPTKNQKKEVAIFVDKIQRLSEVTQTPKFLLLFRTLKDVVVPTRYGYVQSVITETVSLKRDFATLTDAFYLK